MTRRSSSRPACSERVPGLDVSDDGHAAMLGAAPCAASTWISTGPCSVRRRRSCATATASFSLLGARALEACARAGVEVVIYSGRRQTTLFHDARFLGVRCYAFEAGGGRGPRRRAALADRRPRAARRQDDLRPDRGDRRARAAARALRRPARVPRPVAPRPRRLAPVPRRRRRARGRRAARGAGHGDLRLVDNGGIHSGAGVRPTPRRTTSSPRGPRRRTPSRSTCACAATRGGVHRGRRLARGHGRRRGRRTFWLVANGVERDPTIREAITSNVRVCAERNGAGVYEAVITELVRATRVGSRRARSGPPRAGRSPAAAAA